MEISESQTFAAPENILGSSIADTNLDEPLSDSSIMAELSSIIENKSPDISSNVNEEMCDENQISCNNQDSNIKNSEVTHGTNAEDEWLDIMGSGNFKKKVIKPGIDHESRPGRGDKVTVDVSYFVNDSLFEEKKNLTFIVGDLDVIQGLDLAICLMEKGEKAKLQIPSKLAYGSNGLLPNVPPDADIECDIELKEVETVDEVLLTVPDRLKLGDEKRLRGNFFYDRGQHIDAIHCYERAAEYLDGFRANVDSSPEELQEIVDLRLKVYNNMAASHMKLEAYSAALKSIESVLKVQPKNVKALFRKGKILGLQGSTDEAIVCMRTAANLEPQTKVIQIELARLKCQKKREEFSQKVMYQRMFKSEIPSKPSKAVSWIKKWSMISGGVLAVVVGSALAYRQYHL